MSISLGRNRLGRSHAIRCIFHDNGSGGTVHCLSSCLGVKRSVTISDPSFFYADRGSRSRSGRGSRPRRDALRRRRTDASCKGRGQ